MRRVELAMCLRDTWGFNQTGHRGKDSAGSTMGNIATSITERLVPKYSVILSRLELLEYVSKNQWALFTVHVRQ